MPELGAGVRQLPYFSPSGLHVFAHRGLCLGGIQENTLAAFAAALAAGATHIETDVQATADGVAVLFHDDDLERIAGVKRDISGLTLVDLRNLNAATALIPTLDEALIGLPEARFNIDIKRANAIAPTVVALVEHRAADRVLVSSFSERRRKKALSPLSEAGFEVATSAGLTRILALYLCVRLCWFAGFKALSRKIDALQIPFDQKVLDLTHPRLLKFAATAGVRVHYWVVNDAAKMHELVALGASGIVTDRADVAVTQLRH
jgi:glycerophosphoryl diester phosphodiesterase